MQSFRGNAPKAMFLALALVLSQNIGTQAATYTGTIITEVQTRPNTVRVAGADVFQMQAPAGGFTAQERALIVERNIDNALMSTTDRSPAAVEIVPINNLPVIRIAGKHVVTVESNSAKLAGTSMVALAGVWADNIRRALADKVRVDTYIAQLGGSFISSLGASPTRRARLEAARLNRAADAFSMIPADLKTSDSFQKLGYQNLLDRNYVTAAENFKQSLALDTGNAMAHYGLGVAMLKCGQLHSAIKELDMARWLEPDNALVHIALGQAYQAKGHSVAAIKQFQEAILLQPENPEPYLAIADLREARNDMAKSIAELGTGISVNPNSQYLRLRQKDQITWRLIRPY